VSVCPVSGLAREWEECPNVIVYGKTDMREALDLYSQKPLFLLAVGSAYPQTLCSSFDGFGS